MALIKMTMHCKSGGNLEARGPLPPVTAVYPLARFRGRSSPNSLRRSCDRVLSCWRQQPRHTSPSLRTARALPNPRVCSPASPRRPLCAAAGDGDDAGEDGGRHVLRPGLVCAAGRGDGDARERRERGQRVHGRLPGVVPGGRPAGARLPSPPSSKNSPSARRRHLTPATPS